MAKTQASETQKLNVVTTIGTAPPFHLEVQPTDTVVDVSQKAAQVLAASPDKIQLSHNGRPLEENATVKDAGLKNGDTVKVIHKNLEGGDGARHLA